MRQALTVWTDGDTGLLAGVVAVDTTVEHLTTDVLASIDVALIWHIFCVL